MKNILLVILFIIFFVSQSYTKEFFLTNKENLFETYVLYIPKRYNYIKNSFDNLKIKPNYIQGPDKNMFKIDDLYNQNIITKKDKDNLLSNKPKKKYNIINTGRIACHLGHINILKQFLNSNNKYALIFEDDIQIKNINNLSIKLNNIMNNIPNDADIVYLSYCYEHCKLLKKYNDLFYIAERPLCRHSYAVSKKGAQIIINKTLPMNEPGDRMLANLIKKSELKAYLVNSNYLLIPQNREDLGTNIGNYDKLKLCRNSHTY